MAPCDCSNAAATRAGVQQIVFVLVVLGLRHPSGRPRRRDTADPPGSVYAETKAIVERVLHWYGEVTASEA